MVSLSHGTLHAMGSIFRRAPRLLLFDPNCGEFRLRESELSSFLGLYFEDVKDAFARTSFPIPTSCASMKAQNPPSRRWRRMWWAPCKGSSRTSREGAGCDRPHQGGLKVIKL
ncbi:MAG: hypothetical protein MZV70_53575 [Desulfobacterales bacterium]|nr:hypothetical protein [Desulfobacterales bacterium]